MYCPKMIKYCHIFLKNIMYYLLQSIFQVRVHFMDKAATTVVANLLHYDKHYNLALFKVSMDLSAQIPSFTSELKFAEEVFVLGRDEGRYLTIDHGNVAYEGPSRLQRHHYMFITRRINKV